MKQLGRCRGRGGGEIVHFGQHHGHAPTGRIPRNATAVDAAADDEQVVDRVWGRSAGQRGGPLIGDMACGPGASALVLAEALPTAQVICIDLHQPFLDELCIMTF